MRAPTWCAPISAVLRDRAAEGGSRILAARGAAFAVAVWTRLPLRSKPRQRPHHVAVFVPSKSYISRYGDRERFLLTKI